MKKKRILSETEWRALFADERRGMTRRQLSVKWGVHGSTICRQASARGLLKRQSGAPDHRCVPPDGWPLDRVFPQSRAGSMTPRKWGVALDRYLAGEPAASVAADVGCTASSLTSYAYNNRRQKKDVPGAVYRPSGPKPVRLESLPDDRIRVSRGTHAFTLSRDDPQATLDELWSLAEQAAAAGEREACLGYLRARNAVRRACGLPPERIGPPGAEARPPDDDPPAPPLILRDSQIAPGALPDGGPWSTWLFLGGRGAGKTLAGASWLADQAEALGAGGRLALIGPTLHDVREVMIEGVSGVRSLPRWTRATRPKFQASRRRLMFDNGCVAYAFSAEDPDSLRGPQFSAAWADEFCAWRGSGPRGAAETLALLRMGLRLAGADGQGPRLVVTTTPRPTRALVRLRDEATCALTHAPTAANAAHLSPGFLDGLQALYGGTRRAAQELEGKIVELDGALLTAAMMARARMAFSSPPLPSPPGGQGRPDPATSPYDRIVVAIDPTATAGGAACGLIAAARFRRADGVGCVVVLADRSIAGLGPDAWARRAVALAGEVKATALVAEVNQGGDMVKAVLKTAGCRLKVREVHATRGKYVRAEPVAALYEQGRIHHAGAFDALEEELMAFGGEMEAAGSLDRADALVWAITDLLIDAPDGERGPRVRAG
ncbi:terminase large subunit domain-containing protein [Brevundimonas sp. LjRoot202]|uniref:terminase large subunit domain-containing protein n=1 Tax=Brevundimonas sp. LjRoot202 TaxID=3342281 RepID=UPI003ECC8BDC